jgi:Type II secretion system (T2SS), protein M
MTQRDRYILIGVAVLGVFAAFWMLALSPKMKALKDVKKDLAAAEASLQQSRTQAAQYAQARLEFPKAYAQVARLGKAVPTNTDQTSLIYQIEKAADRANVDFDSLVLDSEGGAEEPAPAAAAPPAGATGQSGAQPASGQAAAPVTTPEVLGSVPANALATAAAPTGASTGAASLRVMHFTLDFRGSFLRLEDFLREIKRMTWSNRKQLTVAGRLVSVDSIEFDTDGRHVKMNATTYLLPTGQSLFVGATPAGPAGADQAGAQAASTPSTPTAPPAATVSAR